MKYTVLIFLFLSFNCYPSDIENYFNKRIETLVSKKLISIKESQYLKPNSSIKHYDGMIFASNLGAKKYDDKAFYDRISVHQLSDFVTFDKSMESLAEAGDVKAMYYLALHYLDKDSTCKEGVYWLEKAYQKKLVMAAFTKGRLMHTGRCGFKESLRDAVKMYEIGLTALEPKSIEILAMLVRAKLYVLRKKDGSKVSEFDLQKLAALYGSPSAQAYIASMFAQAKEYDLSYMYCVLAYSAGSNPFIDFLSSLKKIYKAKITTNKEELKRFKLLTPYRYYSFGYAEYFDGKMYFD